LLMMFCAWRVALFAGQSYELAIGKKSRVAGWLALAVAASPLTLDALRWMNVSPLIAMAMGYSIFGLLGRSERGAVALALGAMIKYSTGAMLPMYVAMRQWRAIAIMAITGVVILAASLAVMGPLPFRIFLHEIVPTLSRPHVIQYNRSVSALAMRLQHGIQDEELLPLTGIWPAVIRLLQWAAFLAIAAIIFTRKSVVWRQAEMVLGASAALVCWFMAFSPILWDHYLFYLVPLWGWLVWEARGSSAKTALVVAILTIQIASGFVLDSEIATRLHLLGPYCVFPLLTVLATGMLGLARVAQGETIAWRSWRLPPMPAQFHRLLLPQRAKSN
jgi:hypothetical protein